MASAPRSVELFSPLFGGSDETWAWLCDVSNGRRRPPPKLNQEQTEYAANAGYLPTDASGWEPIIPMPLTDLIGLTRKSGE